MRVPEEYDEDVVSTEEKQTFVNVGRLGQGSHHIWVMGCENLLHFKFIFKIISLFVFPKDSDMCL